MFEDVEIDQTAEVDGVGSKPYVLNKLTCTS